MKVVEPIRDKEQLARCFEIARAHDRHRGANGISWELLLIVGFNTSLRISDFVRFRVKELRGQEYARIVAQKTGKDTRILINPAARREIGRLTAKRDEEEYVFQSRQTDKRTHAIAAYEVQYADSGDGTTWGAWKNLTTVNTTATGAALTVSPPSTPGEYRRFQVRTISALGVAYYSAWKVSTNSVQRNAAPGAPNVFAPIIGAKTFNARPRLLVIVPEDAEGHAQTLTAAGYTSRAGVMSGQHIMLRKTDAAQAGDQLVNVATTDALGATESTECAFEVGNAEWVDPEIVVGMLPKAAHIGELQEAIDDVMGYYAMDAYAWTEIIPDVTPLGGWTDHINELREAIEMVATLVNGWDANAGADGITLPEWIAILENKPLADVMEQIRAVIPTL